ncbi:MAG: protein kinase [Pseudonocardia sp.]|nr:protein kinase [Pseudonocardia sp.]
MAPEMFGPYRLDALVGRGGMGEVWSAFDTRRKRTVALKRLTAEHSGDPGFEARFRRECELAARLAAPNVIPIHDFGEIDGRLYLDMRFVPGKDLAARLRERGPLPPAHAVRVVGHLAAALDAAHAAGLVHRDVKPSNALVTEGEFVYLVDFGIVKTVDGGTTLTGTNGVVGTVGYLAPERLTGGREDHRVDVYSLACLLHESLTGARPFSAPTPEAVMIAHVQNPPPRPGDTDPALRAFDEVVARGMAKEPGHRYPSAGALAIAATQALTRPGTSARAPTARVPAAPVPPVSAPDTVISRVPIRDVPTPRPAASRTRRRARGRLVGATAAVLAAGAVATLVAVAPWRDGDTPGVVVPTFAPVPVDDAAALPRVLATVRLGGEPRAVVTSADGRRVHVLTVPQRFTDQIVTLDAATNAIEGAPIDVSRAGGGLTPAADGRSLLVPRCDGADGACALDRVVMPAGTVEAGTPLPRVPTSVLATPDGRRAFVLLYPAAGGATAPSLVTVDLAAGTAGAPLPVTSSGPRGVALAPDGNTVLVADGKSSLTVLDPQAGGAGTPITTGQGSVGVAVSPDGRRAYVSTSAGVVVVDLAGRTVAGPPIPVGAGPAGIAVSPDGSRLYVANSGDGTVSVIDTGTLGAVGRPIPVGRLPTGVAVSPDGSRIYVLAEEDDSVTVLGT